MYKTFFKRFLDFTLSLIGLIIVSPIFLVVWAIITVINNDSGGFFLQERSGKNEKIFKVIKFRTMTNKRDSSGNLLPDSQRITKFGKFLRQTSFDEIPQLINVVKGDMSLVGPRPLLPEYTALYNKFQIRRLEVKPGITGWAQVHGRNSLKLSKRFELDVYYVDHLSIIIDMKIIWLTIINLFKSKVVIDRGKLEGVDDLGFDKIAFKENHK